MQDGAGFLQQSIRPFSDKLSICWSGLNQLDPSMFRAFRLVKILLNSACHNTVYNTTNYCYIFSLFVITSTCKGTITGLGSQEVRLRNTGTTEFITLRPFYKFHRPLCFEGLTIM